MKRTNIVKLGTNSHTNPSFYWNLLTSQVEELEKITQVALTISRKRQQEQQKMEETSSEDISKKVIRIERTVYSL